MHRSRELGRAVAAADLTVVEVIAVTTGGDGVSPDKSNSGGLMGLSNS